ncbi:MAG: signal peptide peptidase SppA, partial [Desulfovibrio sp.]
MNTDQPLSMSAGSETGHAEATPAAIPADTPASSSVASSASPSVTQSCACPLAQVPATVWKDLLRRPFRKRHPVIFWGLILLLLAGVGVFGAALGSNGLMSGQRIALVSVSGPIQNFFADFIG